MVEQLQVPSFRSVDGLAVFLADLRAWSFSSKKQAARFFSLSHTTIVRYENGQIIPPIGYLAALAAEMQVRQASLAADLLVQVNAALTWSYPNARPFVAWDDLAAAAATYLAGRALPPLEAAHAGSTPAPGPPLPSAPGWHRPPPVPAFYGRDAEVRLLNDWISIERCALIAIVGLGGIGKTALAAAIARDQAGAFERVVWLSLLNAPAADEILGESLLALMHEPTAELPPTLERRIALLIDHLREHRCLLIIDNVESVLRDGAWASAYRPGYAGYGQLFRSLGALPHRSCVILTCRERLSELAYLEGPAASVRTLQLRGIAPEAARAMVRHHRIITSEADWRTFVDRYAGNPLALKLLSEMLMEIFAGRVADFLSHGATLIGGVRGLIDHMFDRLSAVEQAIMFWLAIAREPISAAQLRAAVVLLPEPDLVEALASLRRRSLLETSDHGITLQTVILEYATDQLIQRVCQEIIIEPLAPGILRSHALLRVADAESTRESQLRLIVMPVIQRLRIALEPPLLEARIRAMLDMLRHEPPAAVGYAAGNLCTLLIHLHGRLAGYDFSDLAIRGAMLRGATVHDVSFARSSLSDSVFTETFGPILSVAVTADADLLAAGTNSGEIRLWSVDDHRQVQTLSGHRDWVRALAFTSDGARLVSAGDDAQLIVWEVASGRALSHLRGHAGRVLAMVVAPDGTVISGGEDGTIRVWAIAGGDARQVITAHDGWICGLAISLDGTLLASSGSDGLIHLWRLPGGQRVQTLRGSSGWVWDVAFSPDGTLLASGGSDQRVRIWEVATGQCRADLDGHGEGVHAIAFNGTGDLVASGGCDQRIRLWDVASGSCIGVLSGHSGWVRSLVFGMAGRLLISGSSDQSVRLWDVTTGRCWQVFQGYTDEVWSVAFHPDGHLLASGTHRTVRIWDPGDTSQPLHLADPHQHVWSVAFHPDGRLLATIMHHTIALWDSATGRLVRRFQGHTEWVRAVGFSPDGRLLASASEDGSVRLWNIADGTCQAVLLGHRGWVWTVSVSPDGGLLASGGDDQSVLLWDRISGRIRHRLNGHTNSIWSVAFSPDGRLVASACDDGSVRLWDVANGACQAVLADHAGQVWSVAFSPDGGQLASAGADGCVHLYETATWQLTATLDRRGGRIRSVTFGPDGAVLATGADDGVIALWEVATGRIARLLSPDRPYERLDLRAATGITSVQHSMLRQLGALVDPDLPG